MKKKSFSATFSTLVLAMATASLAALSVTPSEGQGPPLFRLASLNTLHLGYNTPNRQNKENIIRQFVANADVVLLQEVMRNAILDDVTPGSHFHLVTHLQGRTNYREAYAFLVDVNLNVLAGLVTLDPGFSRPPAGILVDAGGTSTWVVNYHAVFGTVANRRAEVSQIQGIYQVIQNQSVGGVTEPRVVIGGDWNFAANHPVFQNFITGGWPIQVQPVARTSLTPNGNLSQPYDHFLWDTNAVVITQPRVVPVLNPPGTLLGWRQQVSDHLGIDGLVH